MSDDFDDTFADEADEVGDPQWRMITPKERKELLKAVFTDNEWYPEGGVSVVEGGTDNPLFADISSRLGAPEQEVRRYYSAWLKAQGFSADDAKAAATTSASSYDDMPAFKSRAMANLATGPTPTPPAPVNPPMPQLPTLQAPPKSSGNSDSDGMFAMMQFLTQQQYMAMQQQNFQVEQSMQQRMMDQRREESQRREAMARDQQFMNQQMAFMREMIKKSGDDGFFDSDMKKIMKEKVVDQMLGEGGSSGEWKDMVKDVLGSDTLKAAVGGIGGAIGQRRQQVPAGYDVEGYNPYAQPMPAPQPQPMPQPQGVMPNPAEHAPGLQPEQNLPGVFFEEGPSPTEIQAQPPQQPVPTEPSREEYAKVLLASFQEMMGPALNDPATLAALQEQVGVAVDTVMVEHEQTLPQHKIVMMTEKLLLIRNLRDIGLGIKDLRSRTAPGQAPGALILAAVVEELRKKPEFYKIFAENTYEELLALIAPFKQTGAVEFDYNFLLQPESAEVCRHMLNAVKQDAHSRGAPQMAVL